ncbi:MAG: hypothetical protein JSU68_07630 [Phycisphaerales bacterium]|nr:MAG: hypothetical protein JSU68_07630 [Phycisphaerales bacterium]
MSAEMPDTARCLGCGYLLRGLTGTFCPECGRRFDPADPTTYGPRRRWRLAGPPSRWECLAIGALTISGLVGASGPARWESQMSCSGACAAVPLWAGLVVVYAVRLVAVLRDAGRAEGTLEDEQRTRSLRWVVLPLCVLLILSSLLYSWPLMVRFHLNRPAFEAAVKEFEAGEFTAGQWVGLYHVNRATRRFPAERPKMVFFETGSSLTYPFGFEYDPNPGHPPGRSVIRVAPSWYTYEE